MSNLSMMEAKLPPGFRFQPREEELVCDYLAKKASGGVDGNGIHALMVDVDLNKCEPWDLPETACVGGKEWYFFSLRDRKYATGQRTNRATESGYWKATGRDRQVSRRGVLVGMRKTLVFYQGRAPKGRKTDWVMHELRMEGTAHLTKLSLKGDWVLCRVFNKSRGGAQAPRPRMELPCHDVVRGAGGGTSSIPPLMDTFMASDQARLQGSHRFYDNLPQTLSRTAAGSAPPARPAELFPAMISSPSCLFGGALQEHFSHCDKDDAVLKAVLGRLSKLDASPLGEILPSMSQGTMERYLADRGVLPHIWNPF